MRVIPPPITQPQEIVEKAPKIDELPLQAIEKPINNIESPQNKIESPLSNNELIIRKKKQYRQFIKLIKEGKFTTAMLTSKLLGVQRNTIMEWLETPKVKAVMNEEVNTFVSKISTSKDWKAQAYLLDKLDDKDSTKDTPITLNNLIQINI